MGPFHTFRAFCMRTSFLQRWIDSGERVKSGFIRLHDVFMNHYTNPFAEYLDSKNPQRELTAVSQCFEKIG